MAFVREYLPGYKGGGPLRTLANMAERLKGVVEFSIVTSDRDKGDSHAYPDVRVDEWNKVGPARVFYASPTARGRRFLDVVRQQDPDVIYLNSFFDRPFSLFPLAALLLRRNRRTIVIAPRGEFSPGALALKPRRKRLFLSVARLLLNRPTFRRWITWQASSPQEKAMVRASMGPQIPVHVAPDLGPRRDSEPLDWPRKAPGALHVGFVGRISPMKNLLGALEILAKLEGPVRFDIAGPEEDHAYWQRCVAVINLLPANINVHYLGGLQPAQVEQFLRTIDVMLLPTFGENFGHAIEESLGAGTPVLISDQTPWRGLSSAGVGWDLPLRDVEGFRAALVKVRAMDNGQHNAMRMACRAFARRISSDEKIVEANVALFAEAIARSRIAP